MDKKVRPCPACGKRERDNKGLKNGFEIFVCRGCHTIYTSHLPELDEREDYDSYYSEANLSVPEFINERVAEIVESFEPYRKTNRLLDVGFGAGTILQIAADQKWTASGTEVSKPAVEQASKRGFDVFHGTLADARFPSDHFDVITASEIIEHLTEPEADLKEIERILRPGGLFWATTPSARSLSFRVMGLDWTILSPPEHVQLYSAQGAEKMLRRAGFSKVKFNTLGLNPAEIVNHFYRQERSMTPFDRVSAAYQLNESMTRNPIRKKIKSFLNFGLNMSRLGDSLKIFAIK